MTKINNIRNFSIIAHIDHGKSTLADRMLEITHTIEARKMKEQVLDVMELERERGITIKMQPVRMVYRPAKFLNSNAEFLNKSQISNSKSLEIRNSDLEIANSEQEFVLNLIDTPGHIDFSYEVSRALKAVEGSILLVDATQGVQAQTLTTLGNAREFGLKIIPVISKIDSPLARVEEVKLEVATLLECDPDQILEVSGRTGEGVDHLLEEVTKRVPAPKTSQGLPLAEGKGESFVRALVFDFKYSNHQGVIVFVRMIDGSVGRNDHLTFAVSGEKFIALEVGTFAPEEIPKDRLTAGEIGYIVTGIKKPGIASVGDTITLSKNPLPAMPGYMKPRPVVWASIYPESQDNFTELKAALGKLRLSDSSFTHEEETSGSLGRGFRCGFLGMLHLEIITERLRREFNLNLVVTTPSITYKILYKNGKEEIVYSPHTFPDDGLISKIYEPMVKVKIITPTKYLSPLMQLFYEHEAEVGEMENWGDNRSAVNLNMPLRELMRNFFDELKSVSSGFASISYEIGEFREADVVRLDILVADEIIPAFSRVVSRRRVDEEGKKTVEKLHAVLPRQMFEMKIQAKAFGRILASERVKAFMKDVTQHMYGGDITRKMKLREKQKKGKKKMAAHGKVNIPQDVFLKMMRNDVN